MFDVEASLSFPIVVGPPPPPAPGPPIPTGPNSDSKGLLEFLFEGPDFFRGPGP